MESAGGDAFGAQSFDLGGDLRMVVVLEDVDSHDVVGDSDAGDSATELRWRVTTSDFAISSRREAGLTAKQLVGRFLGGDLLPNKHELH